MNRLLVHLDAFPEAGGGEPLVDPREEKIASRVAGSIRRVQVYDEPRQASLFPEARNFK
jgi:hypothetical protein